MVYDRDNLWHALPQSPHHLRSRYAEDHRAAIGHYKRSTSINATKRHGALTGVHHWGVLADSLLKPATLLHSAQQADIAIFHKESEQFTMDLLEAYLTDYALMILLVCLHAAFPASCQMRNHLLFVPINVL